MPNDPLSQLRVAAPPLEIPSNTREGAISREEILRLWLSLRLSLDSVAFAVCCTLICMIAGIIFLYGDHAVYSIEAVEYSIIFLSTCCFYLLTAFSSIYFGLRKINSHRNSIAYGFTEEYLYGATPFSQAVNRWEHYSRWKECKGYFLLKREYWYIIPKAMWTENELTELRMIMKKKIGRRP